MSELDTETEAPPSIRDSLNAAMEETVEEAPAVADDVSELVETAAPVDGNETPAEAAQRARDEAGRFAKGKTPAPAVKPVPVAVKPTGKPPTQARSLAEAVTPEMKPPQSWRGPAKEAWGALPETARVEVLRREKEFATQVAAFGEDRKFATAMRQQLSPFEAQIRAEGSTPEKAVGNLLNTAMALRTAPPPHKAKMVAEIISTYGVPLRELVDHLSAMQGGQPVEGQQQRAAAPQHIDPATIAQQVEQQLMQRLGQQRETQLMARAEKETESFIDKQPTHGLDGTDYSFEIREDMADIIERAARRGSQITLEQAYTLAARQHPEVSKVLAAKERQSQQAKASASTQRARQAAVSVRSSPATVPVKDGGQSLRDTLEAAFEANSGR